MLYIQRKYIQAQGFLNLEPQLGSWLGSSGLCVCGKEGDPLSFPGKLILPTVTFVWGN